MLQEKNDAGRNASTSTAKAHKYIYIYINICICICIHENEKINASEEKKRKERKKFCFHAEFTSKKRHLSLQFSSGGPFSSLQNALGLDTNASEYHHMQVPTASPLSFFHPSSSLSQNMAQSLSLQASLLSVSN